MDCGVETVTKHVRMGTDDTFIFGSEALGTERDDPVSDGVGHGCGFVSWWVDDAFHNLV